MLPSYYYSSWYPHRKRLGSSWIWKERHNYWSYDLKCQCENQFSVFNNSKNHSSWEQCFLLLMNNSETKAGCEFSVPRPSCIMASNSEQVQFPQVERWSLLQLKAPSGTFNSNQLCVHRVNNLSDLLTGKVDNCLNNHGLALVPKLISAMEQPLRISLRHKEIAERGNVWRTPTITVAVSPWEIPQLAAILAEGCFPSAKLAPRVF